MECFRIPKNLRSGREVNKKLRKQYVCCIHNVYDVFDSDFLEVANPLQVQKKVDLNIGLLQLWVVRSTMLSTTISSSAS